MGGLLRAQWDRVAAWTAAALGGLLLLIGYFKVSGTAFPAEQIPYLVSAGLGALFLLGIAGTLWISADLRDEYAKLDEIARALQAAVTMSPAAPGLPTQPHDAERNELSVEQVGATRSTRRTKRNPHLPAAARSASRA